MSVFGGSGLSGRISDRGSSLYFVGATELPESAKDFFSNWLSNLESDIDSAIDKINEKEAKPSTPIIDWKEESEDELPF